MITSGNMEYAFITNGFRDWKYGLEKKKGFSKHQASDLSIVTTKF